MGLTVSRGRALAVNPERMLRNEMGCNDPVMVTGWCPGLGQSESRDGVILTNQRPGMGP